MINELDQQTLRKHYKEQKWSQKMIAEKYDCSRKTVGNRLEKFNIEKRDHSECIKIAHKKGRRNRRSYEGKKNPFYEKKHDKKSKEKMRKAAIKRYENQAHPMKEKGLMGVWKEKFDEEEFEKRKRSHYQKVSEKMKGVKKSKEHTKNIRKAFHQEMKNKFGDMDRFYPNYNPKACKLIEEYGKKHGYDFQHAENGGEFFVNGYWVDGYDEEANVVIEVDEPHHFNKKGELQEQDKQRQKEIEQELDCKFIRLRIDD